MRKRKFEVQILSKKENFTYTRVPSPAYKPQILMQASRANTHFQPKKINALQTKFLRPTITVKTNKIDDMINTHVQAIQNADLNKLYESTSSSDITENLSFMNQQSAVLVEEPVHEFEQVMEEFQKIAADFNEKFRENKLHIELITVNCRRIFAMVK